ncbi:MAG: hypothetical protein QM619_15740 [Micropruina sp.]|uniref:hypothetical protein n=1 Tax=Micropruina sp. TaxID=2737536 RepID=UPI0039E43525
MTRTTWSSGSGSMWAGLGYALLPPLTSAAAEARSYAMAVALVTGAMLAFWWAVRRRGYWWICYALLAAASIYVLLHSALAYVPLAVALIWLPPRARLFASVSTMVAAGISVPLAVRVSTHSAQVSWLETYYYGFPQVVAEAFLGAGRLAVLVVPRHGAGLTNVGADTGDAWRGEELKRPSRPVRKIADRLTSLDRVWIFADKGCGGSRKPRRRSPSSASVPRSR